MYNRVDLYFGSKKNNQLCVALFGECLSKQEMKAFIKIFLILLEKLVQKSAKAIVEVKMM